MSASPRKSKPVRPLGAVRLSTHMHDKVAKMPAFNYNKGVHHDYELQGNAMQVPPPKEEKEEPLKPVKQPVQPVVKSGKSDSGSSTKSQPQDTIIDKKEVTEAKVKISELKLQIAALEKEIDMLKEQISERDDVIEKMKAEQAQMEERYKKLYESEVTDHTRTKSSLDIAQKRVVDIQTQLAKLIREQEEKIFQVQKEFDKKLAEVVEQRDKEIAERDTRLNRLKQQMADSLKGNSWERQQQLEELTKELGRIQDEADTLRIKLKQYKANKTCANCQDMASKLERAVTAIKEKEISIKDLNGLCSKFESQLKQQDEILKMFADKKGHRVTNYPK